MATQVTIQYKGNMNAQAAVPSGRTVDISAGCSGGDPAGISPKDLLAAAYGSCIIMSMDIAAKKHGFDIAGAAIGVSIHTAMRDRPQIDKVDATVTLPTELTPEQIDILRQGADFCPIHHALGDDIQKTLAIETAA